MQKNIDKKRAGSFVKPPQKKHYGMHVVIFAF